MNKTSKLTEGVFEPVVTNKHYEEFLSYDDDQWNLEIPKYKEIYKKLINENQKQLKVLALLEQVILQLRAKTNVPNLKLSKVNNYIYARAPFYKQGSRLKDIRVIVGKTDIYGEDLNVLLENQDFLGVARLLLEDAMDKEIKKTKTKLEKIINDKHLVYHK